MSSTTDRFLSRLEGVKPSGDQWTAKCPAHDDRHASLTIAEGRDGRVLVHCHAGDGCALDDIVASVGLTTADLFESASKSDNRIVAIYDYVDELGALLFQVVRREGKRFGQRRTDRNGGWIWNLRGTRRVLYRLPQVIDAVLAGKRVWIVEGEKDVHALEAVGEVATCNPMGAGKWRDEYTVVLRGADVVIVQDRDDQGRNHADMIARSLAGVANSVRRVEAAVGKDAADHIDAGRTIGEFVRVTVENPLARNVGGTVNALKPTFLAESGVPSDFPGQQRSWVLGDVIDAFEDLLVMPDPGAIVLALASIVANYASGDVVWPLLVGAPGCGKSEIVNATTSAPNVWSLSSLTPQTLLSGYEPKARDKNRPPASMLLQIGAFGILAFKDLTTVLTMHREARAQIIGQLREVADGKTEKSFGNGRRIEWEGKLGMIAGVTPVIDEQHAFLAVMGERFVLYRMPEVTRRDIARRSLERRGHEAALRVRIRTMVAEFLSQFRDIGHLELPDRFTEPLITLTDIVTRARSGVARDYQTRDVLYLPEPEAPTRLAKQIAQLMAAAIAIGVDEAEAWRIARKVGWDSVPAVRSALIRLLARHQGESLTHAQLEEETGLPRTTVKRVVEDLVVLGLADRRKEGDASNARWLVSESKTAREYWDDDA